MYLPQSYAVTLAFMIVSMLCWGSWANTVKLCPGYRFQLFYWDYVIGLLLGVVFWGLTLGSMGHAGDSLSAALKATSGFSVACALLAGVIFNVANLLLVAAIDIAGLAVAFPVGIGVALVVGAVSSYWISPAGNPLLLFAGVVCVLVAILFDAKAYSLRDAKQPAGSRRGVVISVISGLLMGSFYPFVAKSMGGSSRQGPYATALVFALGVAGCAVPVNFLLMRKPLDGREPVAMHGYWRANRSWHVWGMLGGAIWSTGAVLNFAASRSQAVGPAISYSIGQGATMISACWGVFVWHEFSHAPTRARKLLAVMFIFFLVGLTAVALAPIF